MIEAQPQPVALDQLVSDAGWLLMHQSGPDPLQPRMGIVECDGMFGVALIVDGWYVGRPSAEDVLPMWLAALEQVTSLLDRLQTTGPAQGEAGNPPRPDMEV